MAAQLVARPRLASPRLASPRLASPRLMPRAVRRRRSEYIKCLVLKLLSSEAHEHAALFPALATCLQFSESDVHQLTHAREARTSTRGILASFVGRRQPALPPIDHESAEKAVELTAKAQHLARTDDITALATLVAELAALDEEVASVRSDAARDVRAHRERIEAAEASAREKEDALLKHETERQQQDAKRHTAEDEHLYLRNVLLRYMENECALPRPRTRARRPRGVRRAVRGKTPRRVQGPCAQPTDATAHAGTTRPCSPLSPRACASRPTKSRASTSGARAASVNVAARGGSLADASPTTRDACLDTPGCTLRYGACWRLKPGPRGPDAGGGACRVHVPESNAWKAR
jgi:hypothetical protein